MNEYLELVRKVLEEGSYKENRTDSGTLSYLNYHYKVDLNEGFPLLTTKQMSEFRWNSLINEFLWYLSEDHHINNLTEKTSI